MGTIADIEWRETALSPKERATARDNYVRDFDRQFRDWAGIAKTCIDVERDRDWEILGFGSFHAWLLDAAPASRSYLYLVIGRHKELSSDFNEQELSEIPLGSAGVLASMSKSSRRDPKIRASAKKKPAEFVKDVQDMAPEQMVEAKVKQVIEFTASQWSVVDATFEKYKVMFDSNATMATFIEFLCSEISEWTLHAQPQSEQAVQ